MFLVVLGDMMWGDDGDVSERHLAGKDQSRITK
jgi:hypothetical protein